MSATSGGLIDDAVNQNKAWSSEGLLERLFGRLFRGLVYAQIWEDPVCDMNALQISEADNIVCIASGGCNMMSYLTKRPASITAVDLSPAHVMLNRLKLTAAQHLPDHRAFYSMFGHANRARNVGLFDKHLAPHLPDEERAYWNGRGPLRKRKTLFARGLYRFGVLGRFIGCLHLLTGLVGVRFGPLLRAKTLEEQREFFDRQIAPLYRLWIVRFISRRRASLFGLGIPPAQYDKLAADAGGDVIPVLLERTRKLFCDFPISENYFAWQAANRGYKSDGTGPVPPYLEARNFDTLASCASRVTVLNESVTDMLSDAPAGSKSVYVIQS